MKPQVQADDQAPDWLTGPLIRAGGFRQLIAAAEGRHPIEILASLKIVACGNGILAARASQFCSEAETLEPANSVAQGDGLPLPHPLDFEWRFTDATADDLFARALAATGSGDHIAFLGVPSVVLAALRSGHDRTFIALMEPNVVGGRLEALIKEDRRFILASRPGSAGAAVVDPPWYPKPLSDLLALAVAQCRDGAQVLMSAPSVGVRSGGDVERARLLQTMQSLGLGLLDHQPAELRYRSPAFELAALRAAGLGIWLPDWRTGDLLTLTVDGPGRPPPHKVRKEPAFELTVGGIRIRLLARRPAGARGNLRTVCAGEVLPSVSARDIRRLEGNLWTSGNRVFGIDPAIGLKALLALAENRNLWRKGLDSSGTDFRNLGPIDPVDLVIHQLDDVIVRESLQMTQLVGEAAWATSVSDARFLNGSESAFLASLRGETD